MTGTEVDQERFDAVWAGIDAMAEWTGREEVCIDEIELVEELTDTETELLINGRSGYKGIELRAEIDASAMERVTRHELCHTLDRELGWPSREADGALDAFASTIGDIFYPEQNDKLGEAFAEICQEGPAIAAVHAAVSAGCEDGWLTDGASFVHNQLFAQPLASPTDSFTLQFTQDELGLSEPTWRTPMGEDFLFVTSPYDSERERMTLELALYDVQLGRVTDTLSTPSFSLLEPFEYELWSAPFTPLQTDNGVLLLARDQRVSWRVSAVDGELALQEERWPDLGRVDDGSERDGQLLYSSFNSEHHAWIHADGVTRALRFTSPSGAPGRLEGFRVSKGGALLTWYTEEGDYIEEVDQGGERLWAHAVPFAETEASYAQEGLHGEVLVTLFARLYREWMGVTLSLDPETGRWRLPVGADCAVANSRWYLSEQALLSFRTNTSTDPRTVSLRTGSY